MSKAKDTEPVAEPISRFPVVGVGASAGGLDAFKQFTHALPADTGMAFIFIQHLDANYESTLPAILQRETKMAVVELQQELKLEPDHIYVMPSNKILVLEDGVLRLGDKPKKTQPPHSIDVFFSSLAEVFQSQAIGILLSGMGSDGTIGLGKIKDYGGVTFAQSIKSAEYASMPQHALDAEVVDFELEPAGMPGQLAKIHQVLATVPPADDYAGHAAEENNFKQILSLLRKRRDVDFTYYKQTTIRRRILRRMLVNRVDSLGTYLGLLKKSMPEQDILYQDLLIPVTAFFRDTAIFDSLCHKVLPAVFENKNASTPVRIWVAACSTGEEAYSIAICLHEYLGERFTGLKLQLFATDLSEKAIQKARLGLYSKREVEGVSPERLQAYFTKTDGYYQVKKAVRDLCVFAVHNFLKDPPFARINFISCRNVLIYLESYLQKKALDTFHYALNDKGILLLGKSETAGNATNLFKLTGKQEKLYERKPATGRNTSILPERSEKSLVHIVQRPVVNNRREDFHKNADDILLAKYTPAGVIVNDQADIVQFRGSTGAFLEAAPGKASLSILKMAREGLAFEIRNALHKAKETKSTVIKKDISLHHGDRLVSIEVVPLLQTIEPHYLVLFSEGSILAVETREQGKDAGIDQASLKRIQQLEKELAELREDMRAITEDQEAANEELQSANEELLSGSEELQSLNEELETSKEELQSTNEELVTINQELYERNEQYNQSRLYAEAIVSTIREPLLVLNRDLRIKTANQSFYEEFRLKEQDINDKIIFELQDNSWDIPGLRTPLLNIQTGQLVQHEWEVDFTLPGMGTRAMVLNARPVSALNSEQLILLAFEDVTLANNETRRLADSALLLEEELKLLEVFFSQAPALFCILQGPDHIFDFINPGFKEVAGAGDIVGSPFASAFADNLALKDILDRVYQTGQAFYGKEVSLLQAIDGHPGGQLFMDISCQCYRKSDNTIEGILFFAYDVTEKVNSRLQVEENARNLECMVEERTNLLLSSNQALELSNRNLQEFASIASHDLQEPLRKIRTFTGMLNDRYQAMLPVEAKELLVKTSDAATRMSALVRDILDYSRITQPGNSFSSVDLQDVFNEAMKGLDLLAEQQKAQVSIYCNLPTIEAEPSQMKQLFHNLLANALKFTVPGRAPLIGLNCRMLDRQEMLVYPLLVPSMAYWQIDFADNGIGFEQQFAEQIFSIFEKLHPSESYQGTGIGLALCLKIVTFHNGLIWAEGKENEGAVIHIILPVRQPVETGTK